MKKKTRIPVVAIFGRIYSLITYLIISCYMRLKQTMSNIDLMYVFIQHMYNIIFCKRGSVRIS